jgi:predicted nucleic acid-binding protein
MGFLLDTNIISELRKGETGSERVIRWYKDQQDESQIFLSVLVLGELRTGIENIRRRDLVSARILENWLHSVEVEFANRILPITAEICDCWGRFDSRKPLPPIDGLLAATALQHNLTLVTRNIRDVARSGVECFNPFVD